jgi:hypothetical protein
LHRRLAWIVAGKDHWSGVDEAITAIVGRMGAAAQRS